MSASHVLKNFAGLCRNKHKHLHKCKLWLSSSQNYSTHQDQQKVDPLKGLRVLDLTRILAGPYCTMILGDLGAEIIKVEKPNGGDETRSWGPPHVQDISCYFVSVNRNKKSIAIDLKKGSKLIKQLVEKSDILVENFVPGTMEKLGIGYSTLKQINPKLIFCSITGYGPSGPYKDRGGYDVIAASIGGLLHITGPKDGDPCKVGVAMTDLATGLYAHGAILAAVLQRNITGRGQRIDCNLLSTQIASLVNLGSSYINAGEDATRWGTSHVSIVPYQSFKTKDGRWITIGAGSNELFCELCDTLGLTHMKSDPKFKTNTLRVENRKELLSQMSEILLQYTCDEWLEKFKNCKFPYGPVNDMQHAFNDPQVQHNNMRQTIGNFQVMGPAVTYSNANNVPRCPPPKLGEHTNQILRNTLQLNDEEIRLLHEQGIVC